METIRANEINSSNQAKEEESISHKNNSLINVEIIEEPVKEDVKSASSSSNQNAPQSDISNKSMQLNQSRKIPNNLYKKKQNQNFTKVIFYMILLLSNTILNYLIKPMSTLIEIVFLSSIINLPENSTENPTTISSTIQTIGWLIIFVLPLYHVFPTGITIIGIHQSFFSKIYATIVLLLEIILNFPLTFLYRSNLYSIFLFKEREYKQLLNPWLVFYPTIYTESYFEIFRNLGGSSFFLVVALIKYQKLKNYTAQTFLLIVLQYQIFFSLIRLAGNILIIIKKVKEKCSQKDRKTI